MSENKKINFEDMLSDAFDDFKLDELDDENTNNKDETYALSDDSAHSELADNMLEDLNEVSDNIEDVLEYPFIEVVGLDRMFEIEYITNSLQDCQGINSLAIVYRLEDNFYKLGNIDLDLDSFIRVLALRKYDLVLHQSEEDCIPLGVDFLQTMI